MIEKISCINLSSRYGNGNIFGQPSGYKTVSVIEAVSNDGIKGYGECYAGIYVPALVKNYIDSISADFIGLPLGEMELFDRITNKHCVSMSGVVRSIIGGIEIAIFDILSKRRGLPLCRYLHDQPECYVKCYYSGGSIALSEREIEEDVYRAIDLGHDAFKMRVGYKDNDVTRVAAARNALGSRLLICDAIQSTLHSWNVLESINNLKQMSKFNLFWAEEFVDPGDIGGVCKLKRAVDSDLAFGESFTTVNEFDSLCARGCIDVAQPDVTQCGGIRSAQSICHHIKQYIKRVAFHIWGGPVAIAANIHMACFIKALYDLDVWVEIPSVEFQITKDLLNLEIENGYVRVPSACPGIGVDIDDETKEKYKFSGKAVFQDTRSLTAGTEVSQLVQK